MNQEIARKAAKWWADQLRKPAILDNGDNSLTGAMTMVLASMLQQQERNGMDTEAIDRFEDKLAAILATKDGRWVHVGVDYHPDGTLQSAADSAGLPLGMTTLPWKTSMNIDGDVIRVSCGYGAAQVEI